MKFKHIQIYWYLIPSLALMLLDEWFKYQALKILPIEGSISPSFFIDFVVHKNFGIAFDIPFRLGIIITISLVIGFILGEIAIKNLKSHPSIAFSALLIIIGALGNLYDRIAYGFTVDYILLFTRSAINLSDLLIILGVVSLLMSSRKKQKTTHPIHT